MNNYKIENKYKASGELSIYSSKFMIKTKIIIEPDSIKILKISKMKKIKSLTKKYKFFSWFLKMESPGCEAFWLSYRKNDGAIFGDHSF